MCNTCIEKLWHFIDVIDVIDLYIYTLKRKLSMLWNENLISSSLSKGLKTKCLIFCLNLPQNYKIFNKLAKLRRHASRVPFASTCLHIIFNSGDKEGSYQKQAFRGRCLRSCVLVCPKYIYWKWKWTQIFTPIFCLKWWDCFKMGQW